VHALRLCTDRTAHRGSRGIDLPFHDHCTRRRWVVSVTTRPLFSPGKARYSLYRRLGGPQGRSGQVRKISPPPGFDPRTVQPVASRYSDWATGPTLELYSVKKMYKLILVQVIWLFFYININNLVTLQIPSYFRIFMITICETFVGVTSCFAIKKRYLTLILLTWRIWWAPNNASKWQMGFNSAFKGLKKILQLRYGSYS